MAAAAVAGAREDEGEAGPAGEEGEGTANASPNPNSDPDPNTALAGRDGTLAIPLGRDAVAARGERTGGGEAAGAPPPWLTREWALGTRCFTFFYEVTPLTPSGGP